MPSPSLDEFDSIKQIVTTAAGLSPASIRYLRARLLEIVKAKDAHTTGSGALDPDVAAAQKKTAELFHRPATGA